MQRTLTTGLTAAASLTTLVVGLAALDTRVHEQFANLLNGRGPSGELLSASAYVQNLVSVFLQAVRDQSMERAPLVIFALAAVVLLLFMLRT
jgi:hypothetical protein